MSKADFQTRYIHNDATIDNLPDPNTLHPVDIIEPIKPVFDEVKWQARTFSRLTAAILRILLDARCPKGAAEALCFVLKCEHLLPTTNKSELARQLGTSPMALYGRIKDYAKTLEPIWVEFKEAKEKHTESLKEYRREMREFERHRVA